MTCGSCGAENDGEHAFCSACGQGLRRACAACGAAMAPGAAFCSACGAKAAAAARSVVADGVWVRPPGEVARRVSRDELSRAFGGGLDGMFAGTVAAGVLDALLARAVRVPPGSVGAILRDGAVARVLPPGEHLTPRTLREALRDAWTGGTRTGLLLVDRRPIVAGLRRQVTPGGGAVVVVEATATFSVPATPAALAAFSDRTVGDRDALGGGELHARLRGELEQAVTDALRAHPADLRAAERACREALERRALAGTGLAVEVALARKDATHRLELRLGGEAPAERPCAACAAPVGAGQGFCTSCGARQAPAPAAALACADGAAVELDLAATVVGDRPPPRAPDAWVAAAAAWLRSRPFAELATPTGFDALAGALRVALAPAFAADGHDLREVEVVDVRSASAGWTLGARAAMERARAAALVGREWLAVKDDERAVEAATLAAVRAQRALERDHAFAEREAAAADAERGAALGARERAVRTAERDAAHAEASASADQVHARRLQGAAHDAALARARAEQASEQRRREAEDADHADRLRREARLAELRGLAALEADVAEREQRHEQEVMARLEGKTEAQMLAMQAGRLASAEHGAAFAEALGRMADGESARRERERADARLDAKDERTMQLLEKMVGGALADRDAARGAYKDAAEGTRDMAKAAVESHAAVVSAAVRPCVGCGARLLPAAKFCGVCGTVV